MSLRVSACQRTQKVLVHEVGTENPDRLLSKARFISGDNCGVRTENTWGDPAILSGEG